MQFVVEYRIARRYVSCQAFVGILACFAPHEEATKMFKQYAESTIFIEHIFSCRFGQVWVDLSGFGVFC